MILQLMGRHIVTDRRLRGILLDRDGVINRERADYVKCWDEFELLPGALEAIRRLSTLSVPIAVITNQSAIGRGLADRHEIDAIHLRLSELVRRSGGRIDGFFLCPHTPADDCQCRKPRPGLLLQAAERFRLDLSASVFVGDALTDYQAAVNAGCRSLLVRSGRRCAEIDRFATTVPSVHVVDDLSVAAAHICQIWA